MITIPNYHIGKRIGQGGMASVYKAKHKFLPKQAAVKIMSTALSSQPLFQTCFIEEANTLNRFAHNNIIQIYDMGVVNEADKDLYYITMEYLEGGTLQTKLTQGTIPLDETLHIISGLANALQSVHRKGFIHRDLKPANIMFRNNGDVVLTDFGIAKLEGTTGALTQMNLGAGSANYMAPEQAEGKPLDQHVDIYSLGIIFYEMLVGKKPFSAENTTATLYQHIHTKIPSLPKQYSGFQSILEKVLAKKPNNRYNKATDFIDDLNSTTLFISKPPLIPRAKYKYILWFFIIAIIMGGGFLLYTSFQLPKKPLLITIPSPEEQTTPVPQSECSIADHLNGKC